MPKYDFLYLQNEVKDALNFNSSQTDQDFTTAKVKNAINRAQLREVSSAKLEGLRKYFQATAEFVWPSGDVTLTKPRVLENVFDDTRYTDITDADPGSPLTFGETETSGDVFWKDRNTLQWGSQGPSSARTIRVEFNAEPVDLVEDDDTPDLILPAYREILVWSTVTDLISRAEQETPPKWENELNRLRMDYWKRLSLGKPFSDYPVFKHVYPYARVGFLF